jgi:hypothetical protein
MRKELKMTKISINAAPSPNGTNRAGLYLGVLGRGGAAFAQDSARRRQAKDSATSDAMDQFQQFLNEALTDPSDRMKAETLLTALLQTLPAAEPDDDDSDADPNADQTAEDRRRKMAGDGRPGFPHRRDPRSARERFGDIATSTQLGPRR